MPRTSTRPKNRSAHSEISSAALVVDLESEKEVPISFPNMAGALGIALPALLSETMATWFANGSRLTKSNSLSDARKERQSKEDGAGRHLPGCLDIDSY
jgi:hypothetical protein